MTFLQDPEPASEGGLPIRWTLGLHWHFCCQGSISNMRPVLGSAVQITWGKVLECFAKPANRLVTLVFGEKVFSRGLLETKLALWAQIDFLVSGKHTTSGNLIRWILKKKNDQSLNYHWYTRARYHGAHADQFDFLNYVTKTSICQRSEAPQKGSGRVDHGIARPHHPHA